MMAQPPTTSLASAYGPSTRLTSPWRTTKFTASSVPYRPPPSRNTPFAARSPMWASIASNSACGGVPTPSSILTNPMNRGMSITPLRWRDVASARTSDGCSALRHRSSKFFSVRAKPGAAGLHQSAEGVSPALVEHPADHGLEERQRLGVVGGIEGVLVVARAEVDGGLV